MIVRPVGSSWQLVAQADHARLAGELVGLLRLAELVEHPRRSSLLQAIAEHDNGWWEEDAAPRLDPATGGPLDFRSTAATIRQEVWGRSAERHAAADPYLAALVAGHLLRLSPADDEPSWAEFRSSLDDRRHAWLEAASVGLDEAARDDRWLQLGDELSLVVASGDPTLLRSAGWRAALGETEAAIELRVTPFPWAGATRFELPMRRLVLAPYSDAVALGSAWLRAPRERLTVRLSPLDG